MDRLCKLHNKINIEIRHIVMFTGFISKIITALFILINTRLLIEVLQIKGFAAYSIIYSFLNWIYLLNFGLPFAIQNKISEYKAQNKELTSLLKLSFFLVISIIIIAIPILLILGYIIKMFLLTNYQFINYQYLCLSLLFLTFAGLNEIYYKIFFAQNKGYLSYFYSSLTHMIIFIILIILNNFHIIKDYNTIIVLSFFPYVLTFLISHFKAIGLNVPEFNKNLLIEILSTAKNFWIFAILTNLTLSIDYIIMSRIVSENDIALYNINFKIFNFMFTFFNTILLSEWPFISVMFYKKDRISKIDKKIFNILKIGFLILILGSVLILIFKDIIFTLVSGKNLTIGYSTVILTAIYFLIRVWTDTYSVVLQSINQLDIFLKIVPLQAFISALAQLFLGSILGLNGILLGLICSFLMTVTWVLPYKYYKIKRGLLYAG